MATSENNLQKFVARARHLFSLPAVAIKVLELTNHQQVDIRALKQCIEIDPAITSKVLRVVNSSLFGLSREVSDLNQALALLGIKPLKLLVLGFSLSDTMFTRNTGTVLLRYWRHTLTRAVAAREIAESICRVPGDEPFIIGLLQDVGMLVLLQELGDPYGRLIRRPFATRDELARLEQQSLGFDHTELSVRLLDTWGFPETILEAIRQSRPDAPECHDPAAAAVARILHLANLVADLLVDARHDLLGSLLGSNATQGRLTQAQLTDLVARIQEHVAQLASVFSLELPAGLDYRDVLVQAHARMSEVSVELAGELIRRKPADLPLAPDEAPLLEEVRELSTAVAEFARRPIEAPPRATANAPAGGVRLEKFSQPAVRHELAPLPTYSARLVDAGHTSAALLSRLELSVQECRRSRTSLSLALVDVDHGSQLSALCGPQTAAWYERMVFDTCRQVDVEQVSCLSLGNYCYAVVLPGCDRRHAGKLCYDLLDTLRNLSESLHGGNGSPTVSIGLASVELPPKNFSPATLMESANRCLSAAQLSGGNALKSIEIC